MIIKEMLKFIKATLLGLLFAGFIITSLFCYNKMVYAG